MPIKSIVTNIDNSELCAKRTHYAIALAKQQSATLTGVASSGIDMSLLVGDLLSPGSTLIDNLRESAVVSAAEAVEGFKTQCKTAEFESFKSHSTTGSSVDGINTESLINDLVVLTQYSESAGSDESDKGLIEHTLLSSATPVLLIPALGTYDRLPGKVLIGWSATRECARAIRGSLPILSQADTVDIVTVSAKSTSEDNDKRGRLLEFLAQQDVDAKFTTEQSKLDPANFLLSHSCDIGADMLVMGGYGHSKMRQWAIGGTTRTILETMTLPVFMAH